MSIERQLQDWRELALNVEREVAKAVIGQPQTIRLINVATFARGHVLLEGDVGVGKTTVLRAFSRAIGGDFERVEGTVDLMPGDLIYHTYVDGEGKPRIDPNLGNEGRIERLREAGLTVFDLGEMRGIKTLLPNIVTIGTLLGRREVGIQLADRFARRMQSIAKDIPEAQRPLAIYASIYGDSLYGASIGTNHHDVLVAAGLRDKAAAVYEGWPRYTPEMVLALDPEVIITQDGMRQLICRHASLKQLRACGAHGRTVEVDGRLLDDPSLTMMDAAEAVYEAVHLAKAEPIAP